MEMRLRQQPLYWGNDYIPERKIDCPVLPPVSKPVGWNKKHRTRRDRPNVVEGFEMISPSRATRLENDQKSWLSSLPWSYAEVVKKPNNKQTNQALTKEEEDPAGVSCESSDQENISTEALQIKHDHNTNGNTSDGDSPLNPDASEFIPGATSSEKDEMTTSVTISTIDDDNNEDMSESNNSELNDENDTKQPETIITKDKEENIGSENLNEMNGNSEEHYELDEVSNENKENDPLTTQTTSDSTKDDLVYFEQDQADQQRIKCDPFDSKSTDFDAVERNLKAEFEVIDDFITSSTFEEFNDKNNKEIDQPSNDKIAYKSDLNFEELVKNKTNYSENHFDNNDYDVDNSSLSESFEVHNYNQMTFEKDDKRHNQDSNEDSSFSENIQNYDELNDTNESLNDKHLEFESNENVKYEINQNDTCDKDVFDPMEYEDITESNLVVFELFNKNAVILDHDQDRDERNSQDEGSLSNEIVYTDQKSTEEAEECNLSVGKTDENLSIDMVKDRDQNMIESNDLVEEPSFNDSLSDEMIRKDDAVNEETEESNSLMEESFNENLGGEMIHKFNEQTEEAEETNSLIEESFDENISDKIVHKDNAVNEEIEESNSSTEEPFNENLRDEILDYNHKTEKSPESLADELSAEDVKRDQNINEDINESISSFYNPLDQNKSDGNNIRNDEERSDQINLNEHFFSDEIVQDDTNEISEEKQEINEASDETTMEHQLYNMEMEEVHEESDEQLNFEEHCTAQSNELTISNNIMTMSMYESHDNDSSFEIIYEPVEANDNGYQEQKSLDVVNENSLNDHQSQPLKEVDQNDVSETNLTQDFTNDNEKEQLTSFDESSHENSSASYALEMNEEESHTSQQTQVEELTEVKEIPCAEEVLIERMQEVESSCLDDISYNSNLDVLPVPEIHLEESPRGTPELDEEVICDKEKIIKSENESDLYAAEETQSKNLIETDVSIIANTVVNGSSMEELPIKEDQTQSVEKESEIIQSSESYESQKNNNIISQEIIEDDKYRTIEDKPHESQHDQLRPAEICEAQNFEEAQFVEEIVQERHNEINESLVDDIHLSEKEQKTDEIQTSEEITQNQVEKDVSNEQTNELVTAKSLDVHETDEERKMENAETDEEHKMENAETDEEHKIENAETDEEHKIENAETNEEHKMENAETELTEVEMQQEATTNIQTKVETEEARIEGDKESMTLIKTDLEENNDDQTSQRGDDQLKAEQTISNGHLEESHDTSKFDFTTTALSVAAITSVAVGAAVVAEVFAPKENEIVSSGMSSVKLSSPLSEKPKTPTTSKSPILPKSNSGSKTPAKPSTPTSKSSSVPGKTTGLKPAAVGKTGTGSKSTAEVKSLAITKPSTPTKAAPKPAATAAKSSPATVKPATASAKPTSGTTKQGTAVKPATGAVKPAAGATKPAASSAKPAAGTAKPAAGAAKPAAGAAKPATSAAKPATSAAKPATSPAKPATGTAKPATGAVKPAASAGKPAASAGKPAASPAKPATGAAKPATGAVKPAASAAKPASGTAKPAAGAAPTKSPPSKPGTPVSKPGTPTIKSTASPKLASTTTPKTALTNKPGSPPVKSSADKTTALKPSTTKANVTAKPLTPTAKASPAKPPSSTPKTPQQAKKPSTPTKSAVSSTVSKPPSSAHEKSPAVKSNGPTKAVANKTPSKSQTPVKKTENKNAKNIVKSTTKDKDVLNNGHKENMNEEEEPVTSTTTGDLPIENGSLIEELPPQIIV